MKRENKNYKIKYERHIEDPNGDYNVNPELLRAEIVQCYFIERQGRLIKLNNHSNNWKIDSFFSSKIINHYNDMDAKIKHRKKREGD